MAEPNPLWRWLEVLVHIEPESARASILDTPREPLIDDPVYRNLLVQSRDIEDGASVSARVAGRLSQKAQDSRPDDFAVVSAEEDKTPHRKASANARMIDLTKDLMTHTWSAKQFAERLGCAMSTVAETAVWKRLRIARESARLERDERKQTRWQGSR
jgi:hypothetical protein